MGNAFVLVRNGAQVRFDASFQAMLKEYKGMFTEAFFERLVIVATRIEGNFQKKQFVRNNRKKQLAKDICGLFSLDLEIPVIPIGFEEDYGVIEASLKALADAIPADKKVFDKIKSPIDKLEEERVPIAEEERETRLAIVDLHNDLGVAQRELEDAESSLAQHLSQSI